MADTSCPLSLLSSLACLASLFMYLNGSRELVANAPRIDDGLLNGRLGLREIMDLFAYLCMHILVSTVHGSAHSVTLLMLYSPVRRWWRNRDVMLGRISWRCTARWSSRPRCRRDADSGSQGQTPVGLKNQCNVINIKFLALIFFENALFPSHAFSILVPLPSFSSSWDVF